MVGAFGDPFPQNAALGVQSNRHHTPRTWFGFAVVEGAERLARGETHLQGAHDALRVGRVHALGVGGVQGPELVLERRQAFLLEPSVQLGAYGQICRKRVQPAECRFHVHA